MGWRVFVVHKNLLLRVGNRIFGNKKVVKSSIAQWVFGAILIFFCSRPRPTSHKNIPSGGLFAIFFKIFRGALFEKSHF